MKMIYVGSLSSIPDRDTCWINSFKELGCNVVTYSTLRSNPKSNIFFNVLSKILNRFNIGFLSRKIQNDLLDTVKEKNLTGFILDYL